MVQTCEPRQILGTGKRLALLFLSTSFFFVQAVFADPTNAPAVPPMADNGFDGTFLLVMAAVLMCSFLVGFGAVIAVILSALAIALTAFGILSSSVMIGFLRRSPGSGLRALFLQIGAVSGLPCGMAAMWLTASLAHVRWSTTKCVYVGGASGFVCGIIIALIFNFVWSRTARWLLRKYEGGATVK